MITSIPVGNLASEALNHFYSETSGRLEAGAVIKLLRDNKYPLLSLDLHALPTDLVDAPEFQRALAEDTESWETQRAHYLEVQDEWKRRGISGTFIKTACVAPSFSYTSDNLDVLVPWDRAAEAIDVIRQFGFVELRAIEEQNKFLFRKFRNGKSVCAIHLHRWVGWNVNFFEEDVILRRSRNAADDPEVRAPSPEDAVLINIAHAYYENKQLSLHDLEKIRVSWQRHELDWEYMHAVPQRSGWYDGFLMGVLLVAHLEERLTGATTLPESVIERCDRELRSFPRVYRYYLKQLDRPVTMPFRLNFLFSKLLYYQKILRDSHDSLWQKGINTSRTLVWGLRLKSGIRPNSGLVVSISGMDGSGKTLQIELLRRVLVTSGVPYTYYWNRIGCSPLTKLLSSIVRRGKNDASSGSNSFSDSQMDLGRRNSVIQTAWAWFMALDLVFRYNWNVRLPILRGYLGTGKVVICDRYSIDAAAEMLTRIPQAGWGVRMAIAFLKAFSPRPHIAFLLEVPVDVAQQRHDIPISREVVTRSRESYLELADSFGAKIMSGVEPPADISDRLAAEVVNAFEKRYPNWLNGLFLYNPNQLNPGMSSNER